MTSETTVSLRKVSLTHKTSSDAALAPPSNMVKRETSSITGLLDHLNKKQIRRLQRCPMRLLSRSLSSMTAPSLKTKSSTRSSTAAKMTALMPAKINKWMKKAFELSAFYLNKTSPHGRQLILPSSYFLWILSTSCFSTFQPLRAHLFNSSCDGSEATSLTISVSLIRSLSSFFLKTILLNIHFILAQTLSTPLN